jgi:hypothetical protein
MPPEPTTPPPTTPPAPTTPPVDPAARVAALEAELAALKAKPPTAPTPDPTKPPEDPSLRDKAARDRQTLDEEKARGRRLESAITFNLKQADFLKTNSALLPAEVADIFKQAEKETYSDAIEKDAAIKAGIVQSFFAVQTNVDLLTPAVKAQLDEYLKLTKTGKQDKAQAIYDSVFEPTFEMLKRLKKAEALGKGYGDSTDAEDQYKQKMIDLSRKHYFKTGAKHA